MSRETRALKFVLIKRRLEAHSSGFTRFFPALFLRRSAPLGSGLGHGVTVRDVRRYPTSTDTTLIGRLTEPLVIGRNNIPMARGGAILTLETFS